MTTNAVKTYEGGIGYLINVAIRKDGAEFKRLQSRTQWGYTWGAWKATGRVHKDLENLPCSVEAGFATLYESDCDCYSRLVKDDGTPRVRLPKS